LCSLTLLDLHLTTQLQVFTLWLHSENFACFTRALMQHRCGV
jgi:hypothetical protein